jgi:GTP-binding protein Era
MGGGQRHARSGVRGALRRRTTEEPTGAKPGAELGHRSGVVAIVGRPNVGKSTLLNCILGQRIAIVTPKPQTTRRRVLGIKTLPGAQILFLDTPGLHRPRELMNRRMVEQARKSLQEADLVLWLVDCSTPLRSEDREIAALLQPSRSFAVLNKIDCVAKPELLPRMGEIAEALPGCEIIPVSASSGENLDVLLGTIVAALPEGPRHYSDDEITSETERTLAAEIVREKVILETHDEVPYDVAVTIDSFEDIDTKDLTVIHATIHVNRASQKPILLGRGGSRLKAIGSAARLGIEELLGRRVFLELFVHVQAGWTKDPGCLKEFGL